MLELSRQRAGKPGTEALRAKYKDARPADLEQRTDLAPVVIKTFVRKGVSIMPIFRKTEISDTDLDALAAYLARNTKAKSANYGRLWKSKRDHDIAWRNRGSPQVAGTARDDYYVLLAVAAPIGDGSGVANRIELGHPQFLAGT